MTTTFKLYIEMDNDAFTEAPLDEVVRILLSQVVPTLIRKGVGGMVFDLNGNSVGEYAVVPGGRA